jgi:hypothetical protein
VDLKRYQVILAVIGIVIAMGVVGTSDYEDAVSADQHYIEMVCAGHWPDYDDRKPDCSISK